MARYCHHVIVLLWDWDTFMLFITSHGYLVRTNSLVSVLPDPETRTCVKGLLEQSEGSGTWVPGSLTWDTKIHAVEDVFYLTKAYPLR
jgi:hypothetical protein